MTENLSDAKTCKDFDYKNRFESLFDEASCVDKQDEKSKEEATL